MATGWQHDSPLHDLGDDPGDEPGHPLPRTDPTLPAVNPQSRRLRFRRVSRHDTRGGARSWRHHQSARGRYAVKERKRKKVMLRMKERERKMPRMKERKRKSLLRGGMTALAPV